MLPAFLPVVGQHQQIVVDQNAAGIPAVPVGGVWGSQPTYSVNEKTYPAGEFRHQPQFHASATYEGGVARHMFGPAQAALSAAYTPGPPLSEPKSEQLSDLVATGDNAHPWGTKSANKSDLVADTAVAQHALDGNFGTALALPPQQQSHVQHEMDFAVRHQNEMRDISEGTFKQAMALTGSTVRADSAGAEAAAQPGDAANPSGVNPVHRALTEDHVIGNSITRGPVMVGNEGAAYTMTASGNRNYDPLQPETTNIASSESGSAKGWGGGSSEGGGSGPSNASLVGMSESRGEVFEGPRGGTFTQTPSGGRNYSDVKD